MTRKENREPNSNTKIIHTMKIPTNNYYGLIDAIACAYWIAMVLAVERSMAGEWLQCNTIQCTVRTEGCVCVCVCLLIVVVRLNEPCGICLNIGRVNDCASIFLDLVSDYGSLCGGWIVFIAWIYGLAFRFIFALPFRLLFLHRIRLL